MTRNKRRLQLALYARPKHPGSYHYAFFVAPKNGSGSVTKHHALNTLQANASGEATQPWRYEQTSILDIGAERRLLVRVIVAKIVKPLDQIESILKSVPIYQDDELNQAEGQTFSCRTWARDALHELLEKGAVTTSFEGWEVIHQRALQYVTLKKGQGRWDASWKGASGVPVMDLLQDREEVE